MERLLLVGAVVALAAIVAVVVQRRARPRTAPAFAVPDRIARGDFAGPGKPWLVVAFTSTTCDTCGKVVELLQPLASEDVAIQDVAYEVERALHRRYGVASVPLVVVADGSGAVKAHAFGPQSAASLWSLVSDARSGS